MQPAVSLSGPVRKSDVQGEALSHIPARRLVSQGVVWGMGYVLCLGALSTAGSAQGLGLLGFLFSGSVTAWGLGLPCGLTLAR